MDLNKYQLLTPDVDEIRNGPLRHMPEVKGFVVIIMQDHRPFSADENA